MVEGTGPSLMGRDWLRLIRLDWASIHKAEVDIASAEGAQLSQLDPPDRAKGTADTLLDKYAAVFQEGPGEMNTFEATLHLKNGARPRFCRARPVPFALKETIEQELDRLETSGIIEKVTYSPWAAPVVPVPKGDGHIRLCGDYNVTINPKLEVDKYPLPKPEEIFATLAGGKIFSKIDMTHAYQQMRLTEDCRILVTINTHRGFYRYTRLPFGVASAPGLFQRVMDTVMQGLPGAVCYLDDILITGATLEEHLETLEHVLHRLQTYGIRAK